MASPPSAAIGNLDFLLDPSASSRLKAIVVALGSWCELHLLALRANDLLSTAHINRIDQIPDGLYQLVEKLRAFEKRYSQMLAKVNQYPDPVHIVFFAKTFSERIFHVTENIEAQLSSNLARAAQTRAQFRRQIQESDVSLQNFEAVVYESVASASFGRSKVQKVFFPQPHPLEFIPGSIEPPHANFDGFRSNSNLENAGLFATALVFLRNRRRELLSLMQILNESRFQVEFSSHDVRDFHHEVDVVESEIALVTNLQRILTTVRMMEEARRNSTPTMQASFHDNVASSIFRETVELFVFPPSPLTATTPSTSNIPTGSHRAVVDPNLSTFYGIPRPRPPDSYQDPFTSSPHDFLTCNTPSNISNSANHHNYIPSLNELSNHASSSSRLSEPLTHSWMLPEEREMDRARVVGARSRWFSTENQSTSNLNETNNTPRQFSQQVPSRWNENGRTRDDFEPPRYHRPYQPAGQPGHDINTDSTGHSAFIRVQRNPTANPTEHIRSRASSVAEASEFGSISHHNYEQNVITMDAAERLFAQTVMAGYDRQNTLLQEMMSRVSNLSGAVRTTSSVINRNNSHLTDLIIAVDELARGVAKIQEDVEILKTNNLIHARAGRSDSYTSHIPTRNGTEDNWRNNDISSRIERIPASILQQSWDSSRSSTSGLRDTSSSNTIVYSDSPQQPRFERRTAPQPLTRSIIDPIDSPTSGGGNNSSNSSHFMLNNQIPPGNRANNYWDNFKSYSRLNLLSNSKTNIPGLSPSSGTTGDQDQHHHVTNNSLNNDDVFHSSSPLHHRDSRGDRPPVPSTIRSSLSANFVENIGQKKRNKDQKKQFSAMAPTSPAHSSSSNSSTGLQQHDAIFRSRSSNVESHDHDLRSYSNQRNEGRDISMSTPLALSARNSSVSNDGVERPLDSYSSAGDNNAPTVPTTTTAPTHVTSPPSSLEVELVSRDEFLQLNSGAGSSASGNGRSDDGGPSSSSSKRELEKLLASSDNEDFPRRVGSGGGGAAGSDRHWYFDSDEMCSNNNPTSATAASAQPEQPDWSWPGGDNDDNSEAIMPARRNDGENSGGGGDAGGKKKNPAFRD